MAYSGFLTIDSGGSKTRLGLYSHDGALIKEGCCQGYGLASDEVSVISPLARELFDFCVGYDIGVAVCNVGGKNKNQLECTIKSVFPSARIKVFRESEGVAGAVLCKKFNAQVTLMAGTGTIAIAPTGESLVIVGGWGPNVSDKGSGYQLGLNVVRLVLEELDGVQPLSLLTRTLTGAERPLVACRGAEYCKQRDDVRARLAPFDRASVAALTKQAYNCATAGDEKALALFEQTGNDLAELVVATAQKAGVGLTDVVVTGGMVKSRELWIESFENRLKESYDVKKINYVADGADLATYCVAKNILEGE